MMNSRQRKTLEDIFHDPIKTAVTWSDIESLLRACGAQIEEGGGSRICVHLNAVAAVFHRPPPEKETDKGALRSVRRFLKSAGARP